MERAYLTAANLMLYGFVLFMHAAEAAYVVSGADVSALQLPSQLGLLYAFGYWLQSDSRRRGFDLPYCPGMLLATAWPVLLPYYLFRTRGRRALLTVLIFSGFYVLSAVLAGVLALTISAEGG